jgi:hypothetical protein
VSGEVPTIEAPGREALDKRLEVGGDLRDLVALVAQAEDELPLFGRRLGLRIGRGDQRETLERQLEDVLWTVEPVGEREGFGEKAAGSTVGAPAELDQLPRDRRLLR